MASLARHWLTLIRASSLGCVVFSTALLLHYLAPVDSSFCGAGSGCEAVRRAAPKLLGMTHALPLLGVVAYVGLFWLSFAVAQRRLLCSAGMLGGLVALGLFAHQVFVIGHLCWLCLAVNLLAASIGLCSLALLGTRAQQGDPLRGLAWFALFALAINTPSIWARIAPPPPLPQALRELQRPGVLNVFEFVDFQCPHCRRLHATLKIELDALSPAAHFQRFHKPLRFHPLAEAAARAAICAGEQGQEQEMADRLFQYPLEDGVWTKHASALGLDRAKFDACLPSPRASEVLARHDTLFTAVGENALPLTIIGDRIIPGNPGPAKISSAFLDARGPAPFTLPAWLFSLALLSAVAGVIALGLRPRALRPEAKAAPSAGS